MKFGGGGVHECVEAGALLWDAACLRQVREMVLSALREAVGIPAFEPLVTTCDPLGRWRLMVI